MQSVRKIVALAFWTTSMVAGGANAASPWLPLCPDAALCATFGRPFVDGGKVLLPRGSVEQSVWVSLATLDGITTPLRNIDMALPSGNYAYISGYEAKIYDANGNLLYTSSPSHYDGFSLAEFRAVTLGPPLRFGGTIPATIITGVTMDTANSGRRSWISQSRDDGRRWEVQGANITIQNYESFAYRADGQGVLVIPGSATPGLWQTPTGATPTGLLDFTRLERVDDGSFPAGVFLVRGTPPNSGLNGGFFVALTAGGMYQSADSGRTWSRGTFNGLVYDMVFPLVPSDILPDATIATTQVIAAPGGLYVSRDRGLTWTEFARGLPADRYTLATSNGAVVAAGAGGAFVCRALDCDGPGFGAVATLGTTFASVSEFYNVPLDHYFITADEGEKAFVRNGGAGAGWTETGEKFWAWSPTRTSESAYVCRFYGDPVRGPNSHFYSGSTAECRGLLDLQAKIPATEPRWNSEGNAFKVSLPNSAGQCPVDLVPVHRAYNDGFAKGKDGNHRYVLNRELLAPLIAQGWKEEGVAFCVPATGA
jgi:hypothetical protein